MANKSRNSTDTGTNKTRAQFSASYRTWENSGETWDEATFNWDLADGVPSGTNTGTNKTRN